MPHTFWDTGPHRGSVGRVGNVLPGGHPPLVGLFTSDWGGLPPRRWLPICPHSSCRIPGSGKSMWHWPLLPAASRLIGTRQSETLRHVAGRLAGSGAEGKPNVMTIACGTLGAVWGRPVFPVPVGPSRHTYSRLEEVGEFTVGVVASSTTAICLRMASADLVNAFSSPGSRLSGTTPPMPRAFTIVGKLMVTSPRPSTPGI